MADHGRHLAQTGQKRSNVGNSHKQKEKYKKFIGSRTEGQGFADKRKRKIQYAYLKMLKKERQKEDRLHVHTTQLGTKSEKYTSQLGTRSEKHTLQPGTRSEKHTLQPRTRSEKHTLQPGNRSEKYTSQPSISSQLHQETPQPATSTHKPMVDNSREKYCGKNRGSASGRLHQEGSSEINTQSTTLHGKPSHGRKGAPLKKEVVNRFSKAENEHRLKKERKTFKQQEFLQKKQEHGEAMAMYRKQKQETFKKICKKTHKGQPVMKNQIEYLLQKIEKQINQR